MIHLVEMENIEPGNPFLSDAFRMGAKIGENVIVMYEKHNDQRQPYIVVVNTETGERTGLVFDELMDCMAMPYSLCTECGGRDDMHVSDCPKVSG